MTANLRCLPDEELATRCREELPHGLASFNELVRRYEHIVFGTCLKILQNPQDAEEASQDVFLRLARKIHLFQGRSKFKTWFFRLAHNVAFGARKGVVTRRKRREALVEHAQETSGYETEIGNGGVVFDILDAMDPEQREIILLRFAPGLEFAQMAEILRLKLSATKMRYYRAMEGFEERFGALRALKSIDPQSGG